MRATAGSRSTSTRCRPTATTSTASGKRSHGCGNERRRVSSSCSRTTPASGTRSASISSAMDDYKGAEFREADFTGARFRGAMFKDVKITDGFLVDVDIDGFISNFVINGIDVVPYVQQEFARRHPEVAKLAPADPNG